MNPQLTAFLQYDYAEARTVATTLLTVSGGLLAGGILFGEKYGNLHRATGKPFRLGMLGLYAFATAGMSAGLALLTNFGGMVKMLRRYRLGVKNQAAFAADVTAHNMGNAILFILAGAIMALGMFCLFMSADARQREREVAKAGAEPKPEEKTPSLVAAEESSPAPPVASPAPSHPLDEPRA
jgi:hypothetical protein